jgi:signal transduction histidine kinase/ligand-binding sensor domain-containing protein
MRAFSLTRKIARSIEIVNASIPRPVELFILLLYLSSTSGWAVDPSRQISQYGHSAWRVQDGLFKGMPYSLVQTQDGYLWLGTSTELLRFDGVRFVPWASENRERLPSGFIAALLASRDGSLWINSSDGLSRWSDRTLTNIPVSGPHGGGRLLEDRDGRVWATLNDSSTGGLCRVMESTTHCVRLLEGVGPVYALIDDQQGNLWIGGATGLLRWREGAQTIYQTAALKSNSAVGISGLAAAPDGSIWVGIAKRGRGLGLQQLTQGRWHAFKTADLDGETLQVLALHLDQSGVLWIGTGDRGIYRIYTNKVDHFDTTSGLSSNLVLSFLDDREGNLWVVTNSGIDRFSDTPVVGFTDREGLCGPEVDAVLASRDGSVWVGSDGSLGNLRDGRVSCVRTGKGLHGTQVTSLLEDHAGRLWVGLDKSLWVNDHGRFRKITKPDGSEIGFVTGLDEDANDNVWVVARGSRRVLLRIQGSAVREEYDGAPTVRRVAADPTGGLWLGLVNGDLSHFRDGVFTTYQFVHGEQAGVLQLLPETDGSVLAATAYGLIGWQGGRQLLLNERNGLPCNQVNGIVFDDSGNLWIFMNCALGEVSRGDLQAWRRDSDTRVSVRTLDEFDGVRTGFASFLEATRSPDGRLWFSNGAVLQMVDPTHLHRDAIPPPVHIEQVIADHKTYSIAGPVLLPPLTRDLEIDYVGLSFTAPQRVRFRYRLDGRDDAWQEPNMRRQAFYTDLRPGTYSFRVLASNGDGVWNNVGATINFTVEPAWFQTNRFRVLCVAVVLLILWAFYRIRVKQVAKAIGVRFDERLAERTRIARDIHDTFLQTIQGSKLVADSALKQSSDPSRMRVALEQLSIWLGRATDEGRAALNSLRTSTTEANDLAEAFRRAIDECRIENSMESSFSVVGETREMHPIVRDEVYRIGYEAIRNACVHSQATKLQVTLTYDEELRVRVVDDGVGMDPFVAGHGREGHFGLKGMRERAARIAGKLTVTSSPTSGTEVMLVVPGKIIYRKMA